MSRSSSAHTEKKNVRYFSDIIRRTRDILNNLHSAIGNKPLDMTLMNREFELGDQKRGIYECGEKQHPVQALENFMRDIQALEQPQSTPDTLPPTKSKRAAGEKQPSPKQVADAKQLKKVALFLLHCYVRIFMMQAKKDLAEPHTINTVSMIEDSEILPQVWQSEMDAEMKAFAREKGFDVRAVIFKSKSTLCRIFTTSAELEKLCTRWEAIQSGAINFRLRIGSSAISSTCPPSSSDPCCHESSVKENEDDDDELSSEPSAPKHGPSTKSSTARVSHEKAEGGSDGCFEVAKKSDAIGGSEQRIREESMVDFEEEFLTALNGSCSLASLTPPPPAQAFSSESSGQDGDEVFETLIQTSSKKSPATRMNKRKREGEQEKESECIGGSKVDSHKRVRVSPTSASSVRIPAFSAAAPPAALVMDESESEATVALTRRQFTAFESSVDLIFEGFVGFRKVLRDVKRSWNKKV